MLKISLGLMGSGKSLNLITNYNIQNDCSFLATIGVFTYDPDSFETKAKISTRNKDVKPITAINLSNIDSDYLYYILKRYDNILVDEIQFAPIEHLDVFLELSKWKNVEVYGLSLDFLSNEFESVKYLRKQALFQFGRYGFKEKFLTADCEMCGNEAEHNIRVIKDDNLFVVTKDVYKTVCADCKKEIEGK